MSDFAKELWRVPFFLKWISVVGRSDDFDFFRDNFPTLAFPLRRNQRAAHSNGRACHQALHRRIIRQRVLRNDLQIAQTRAIVQFDERKIFRIAPSPHPAIDQDGTYRCGTFKRLSDWRG